MPEAYSNIDHASFFAVLKSRVAGYFADKNIHSSGSSSLMIKGLLLVLIGMGLYVILVFFTPNVWISMGLCVLLGLNLSLIGFNIMHEGGHQTFSKYGWINTAAAHFLNVLGGNAHYWKIKHNVNHHTHTNIEGLDSDIDVKPFMRLHEGQPLRYYHRFQHLYWIILYGISYLAWVFYEDFQKYFSGRIYVSSQKKKLTTKQHLVFWFSKTAYVMVYIVLPIAFTGWLPWLIGFLIITVVCGISISLVFQLAHVVEGTRFFHPDDGSKEQGWAVNQLRSTADFATNSRVLHWMLGGLNFQIEHHLFPRVSHVHYPAIAGYVKHTCKEYGIVYNEYKTMFSAIISHLVHLRRLGRATPAGFLTKPA